MIKQEPEYEIVNNGAVMRILVRNNVMIQGLWLKPGDKDVMIPNNKTVNQYTELGIAEVVKWRKHKRYKPVKVGPSENTALKPILETAVKPISQDEKPVPGGIPKGQKKSIEKRR